MALIDIRDLTFAYPGSYDNVFEHLSLQLDTHWRLGLVGRNGRGKTTLLRLLQRQYEYDGAISVPVPLDCFPSPVSAPERDTLTILEEQEPGLELWRIYKELDTLEVDAGVLFRPYSSLSGGEQVKVLLAALFLREGAFLLLDEPTNHLDLEGRRVVSRYLSRKSGFLLVSHDRVFLDGCVDHILSINRADIQVQKGNFTSWYTNFERQQQSELERHAKLQKDVASLRRSAERTAGWSRRTEASKYGNGSVDRGFIGHKSAKMMKRAKVVEARQQRALREKEGLLKNLETAQNLKLFPLEYRTDTLVSFADAAPIYDGNQVCAPVTFSIQQGDRIALEGRNGSGKSSLLKFADRRHLWPTAEGSRWDPVL